MLPGQACCAHAGGRQAPEGALPAQEKRPSGLARAPSVLLVSEAQPGELFIGLSERDDLLVVVRLLDHELD